MKITLNVTDEGLVEGAEFTDWLATQMAPGTPVVVKWDRGGYGMDAEVERTSQPDSGLDITRDAAGHVIVTIDGQQIDLGIK